MGLRLNFNNPVNKNCTTHNALLEFFVNAKLHLCYSGLFSYFFFYFLFIIYVGCPLKFYLCIFNVIWAFEMQLGIIIINGK
ncbi:hypothetical protein AQUCO_00200593v1 [Aquilegia coerulea]|uniref:Uncharacterized protein n=1 Tax=Aquilegia coerulea TaxID=218851 RepID=A0A2G5F3Z2_AQUCA|nr:hypothetical protein AQUCO_00200593v1 [Aquilegia coerulea]